MSTTGWVILAIVVGVVVIAALAMMASRSRRSAGLRDRFGPEYDRTVQSAGSRRTAERDLHERERGDHHHADDDRENHPSGRAHAQTSSGFLQHMMGTRLRTGQTLSPRRQRSPPRRPPGAPAPG